MKAQTIAYVGLGSNLAQPVVQVRLALRELGDIKGTRVLASSSLYRSPPMGPPKQPHYINAVAKLETRLSARDLLTEFFEIEQRHGRRRDGAKWGPRSLDLDLLLYGELVSNDPKLTLPHPGITERVFVLTPLLEIDPKILVPGRGPAATLLAALGAKKIEKLESST